MVTMLNEILIFILLFVIGVITSYIGAMTGGGSGVLSIASLIWLGIPPHIAIPTSRLGAIGSALSSTYVFYNKKKIVFNHIIPLILIGIIGSVVGAQFLIHSDKESISKIVGLFLLLTLPFIFVSNAGLKRIKKNKKILILGFFIYFFVAVYDGFLGAPSGVFALYVLVFFFGLTYIEANATLRIPWIASLIVSLILFSIHGFIIYSYAAILFIGRFIGAYLGSHAIIRKGNSFARFLLAIFVFVTAIKLLFF